MTTRIGEIHSANDLEGELGRAATLDELRDLVPVDKWCERLRDQPREAESLQLLRTYEL